MTRYQIWQEIENIETQINELKAKQNTLYAELKKLPSGVELKVLEVKSVKRGNSKLEQFIVVSGHGLIQMRSLLTGEVREFDVSGDKIEAVQMLPGWTHNIINLSETEDLVTVMWCNEIFDSNHPDTFFEPV